ncbi:sulfotransferase [Pleurocapsa sp. PCC 7319]|uniref:sulfotransferase family protein n=1 Tax=Pleurocapsa sp. PCC 7319 TaxID=118161 RepID=UPI000347085A|nr:sulfotransferase [Pleurocapsa sp. PCC 7319]
MLKSQYKQAKNRVTQISDLCQYYFYDLFKSEDLFKSIEKYCMFVGYTRSGHSLVGSLLDAHPNIIIGHELNALQLFEKSVNYQKIYYLLLQNSQRKATQGRQETGYSYQVPHQWQGKFQTLKVIGDKRGSATNFIIRTNPKILDVLPNRLNVPIKFIHVVRNPFDNITTMITRKKANLEYGINSYFTKCKTVAYLKTQIDTKDILDVRHESLIDNPQAILSQVCKFLEVETSQKYLDDCASIVFKSPKKTRFTYQWDDKSIELVKNQIEQYEFLQGYSYDD